MNTPASMCSAADLSRFKRKLASADPILLNVIRAAGKFTHTTSAQHSPFHSLARAIAHQQLNGTAAESIFGRFVGLYGGDGKAAAMLEAELVLGTADEKMRAAGLSYAKIASIKDLAAKTLSGVVPPSEMLHTLADEEIVQRISQVRGIGRWTVEMMLMSRLGRPDVLPVDDFGVRNGFRLAYGLRGMPTTRALAEFGERWAPYRSVAAWYLWRAVDLHRAGKLPAPGTATRVKIVKKKKQPKVRVAHKRAAKKSARRK